MNFMRSVCNNLMMNYHRNHEINYSSVWEMNATKNNAFASMRSSWDREEKKVKYIICILKNNIRIFIKITEIFPRFFFSSFNKRWEAFFMTCVVDLYIHPMLERKKVPLMSEVEVCQKILFGNSIQQKL